MAKSIGLGVAFPPSSRRRRMRGMNDREYPSIAVVAIEVVRPMLYGFMMASPFLILQGSELPAPIFVIIGVLYGAFLIWGIVRWINHRPSPPPAAPSDSD